MILFWLTVTRIYRHVICCGRTWLYLECGIYILGDFTPKKLRKRMRGRWGSVQVGCFSYIFFQQKGKEVNAMAKNLAVSPGYGRIETHRRAVKGVLGAGREPRAKPRLATWAGFLWWVGSSFDLLSKVGSGFEVSVCRGTTEVKRLRISLLPPGKSRQPPCMPLGDCNNKSHHVFSSMSGTFQPALTSPLT